MFRGGPSVVRPSTSVRLLGERISVKKTCHKYSSREWSKGIQDQRSNVKVLILIRIRTR